MIELIVSFLIDDGRSLAAAQRVCKTWWHAARMEHLWHHACVAAWPSTTELAQQQLLPGGCRKYYAQRRLAEKQKLKDQCKAWAELSNVNFSEQVQAAAVRISQLDMDERRAQADYDAKSSMNAKTEHAKSMQAVAAAKSQAYERARHEAQQAIHREQRALAEWTQAKEDEAQAKRDLKASEANGVH